MGPSSQHLLCSLTSVQAQVSVSVQRQAHLLLQFVGSDCTHGCIGHGASRLAAKAPSHTPSDCRGIRGGINMSAFEVAVRSAHEWLIHQ